MFLLLWSQLQQHGILIQCYKAAQLRLARQHFCPYYASWWTIYAYYKRTLT